MKSGLANFAIFAADAAICAFLTMAVYGLLNKRVYLMGRWFTFSQNRSEFVQAVIRYLMLGSVVAYFRIFEFPAKVFPYL